MNRRQKSLMLICGVIGWAWQLGWAEPVPWDENGHSYEVVVVPLPGLSWSQAKAAAEAKGGYLATLTSAAENEFVYDLTVSTPGAWGYSAEWAIGPWLGGYQDRTAPDYVEPAGGWRWVTGEPWGYTHWLGGQPDNWLNAEDCLIFWGLWNTMPTWNDGIPATNILSYVIEYEPASLQVCVDIKPGSCPNPLNVKDMGVLPVAILGTADFSVLAIDPVSIRLAGVAPIRSAYEDVATPPAEGADTCTGTTAGPDGQLDLVLKFKAQEIVAALGETADGQVLELALTGVLIDATEVDGKDCIVVIATGKP